MKNVILTVLVMVVFLLCVLTLNFGKKFEKANKNLEEERYSRMVAEETLQKNSGKMAMLSAIIKNQEDKIAKIQETADQEKNANADLKKQYDQLAQSKAELESKQQLEKDKQTNSQAVPVSGES